MSTALTELHMIDPAVAPNAKVNAIIDTTVPEK
jgi:hypothetical protein